ncbi:MAG TPA: o-succinylbenzoate synthase [Longimicrobiales bacterium]|nr:o-succinylbenzoate synthase [Longimicrobiales bacterium]
MVRLERVELREIRLPLKEPFRISSGVMTERRIALLELTDADGVGVWAECVADEQPNYSPETIDTAWLAIRQWLWPRLAHRELAGPEAVLPLLEEDIRGHLMAKGALEMGVWGLVAERERVPLARVLGGERETIEVGISLGIQKDPAALVERAGRALAEGYHKVKLKIGPGKDIEYVGAVREALGADAPLMADANNAYTLADADHLARLDEFDLVMIEQPLEREDLVRHAALQKRLRTPICLDESITSPNRAEDMITLGSGRIINIKPGRVGGFLASKQIHDLCRAHGVPVWCGGMLESGIGRAYNVALASLPGFTIPGDTSPSARYWERDVVTPEWTMDRGVVRVPWDRPGIGVEVDVDRIEALTVRREVLT